MQYIVVVVVGVVVVVVVVVVAVAVGIVVDVVVDVVVGVVVYISSSYLRYCIILFCFVFCNVVFHDILLMLL